MISEKMEGIRMTLQRVANLLSSTWQMKDRLQNSVRHFFESKKRDKMNLSRTNSTTTEASDDVYSDDDEKVESNKPKSLLRGVFYKWLLLALIGIFMATLSLFMDLAIQWLSDLQLKWLDFMKPVNETEGLSTVTNTFSVWVIFGVFMTLLSAIVVKLISEEAVGSGIPEIKTVLRGVQLEGYLNFKTLVAVMASLIFVLSSGLPVGKAGPFVHISAIIANLVSRTIKTFDTGSLSGSLHNEMIAAGCAVGLACTFGASVGGVLFSIEVTSSYFAVRSYWTNFFAATIATAVFKLLRVALSLDSSVISIYQTQLPPNCFFVEELPLFAMIGILSGFGSALFILLHRKIVLFRRNNSTMKKIFDKHWILYPLFISILISSITYPEGIGNLIGGENKFSFTSKDLFLNCTWSAEKNSTYRCPDELVKTWLDDGKLDVFLVLAMFTGTFFVLTALAITLPVPAGIFGPAFAIGAGYGRLIGELVSVTYPNGVRNDGDLVWPAVYAVVGAASFCGGVTNTISTAIISFELTGQLFFILPVMIAVLLSNSVSSYLQPSIYDSLIELRKLPYLPSIANSENFHGITVEQFMSKNVRFLTPKSTYKNVRELLMKTTLKAVPIVENAERQILIGSCQRAKLMSALEKQIGSEARKAEARTRVRLIQRISSVENHLTSGNQFFYSNLSQLTLNADENESMRSLNALNTLNSPKNASFYLDNESSHSQQSLNNRLPLTPSGDSRLFFGNEKFDSELLSGKLGRLPNSMSTPTVIGQNLKKISMERPKLNETNADLYGDERRKWEQERLAKTINLNDLKMDPTPFQFYNNTTLLKAHSMFSLLGLARAYVTSCGQLIGVVSLRDLRNAIEKVNSGELAFDSISESSIEEPKWKPSEDPVLMKRKTLINIEEDDKEVDSVIVNIEDNHTELANRTNFVLKKLEHRTGDTNILQTSAELTKRNSF